MRTLTAAQTTALAALDRATHVRVKVDNADGTPKDLSDVIGQDFLDQVMIDAQTDVPISACTISLRRESNDISISPLREDSKANVNNAGTYAPLLNPFRDVTVEVATMLSGESPASGDWVLIWEGIIDEVDWGGQASTCKVHARDPMGRLNDKFIETVAEYGDDGGADDVEEVIQEILTAQISSPAVTLAYTATSFPIRAYDLAHITVLEACKALADLIGWNLHWRWNVAAGAFRFTLWQPDRTNTTAAYTFGPDDFYVMPSVGLNLEGIRNKGEIVYMTTAGTVATATETRTTSVTLYSTRFLRVDARETSVVTATQAANMLDAMLDDLEEPAVQQQIEVPFFWPIELGDLYAFSANTYYDTSQKFAVFAYRHILSNTGQKRTVISVSGKPSGGYERWHDVEVGGHHLPSQIARPPAVEVSFDANGYAVVSASGDDTTANIYVTVGDGTAPADPTVTTKDGTISGRSGTVATTKKITTGNDAYVRAIAVDYHGNASAVGYARHGRRLGAFDRDVSGTTVTGTLVETTLATLTIPAATLGLNGGLRATFAMLVTDVSTNTKTLKLKLAGVTLETMTFAAGYSAAASLDVLIFNNASASAQKVSTVLHRHIDLPDVRYTTATANTAGAIDLTLTVTLANTADTVSLQAGYSDFVGTD